MRWGDGIDIIRIFDALNNLHNMKVAADQVKKEGAHLQLCIAYTLSPVHTLDAFAETSYKIFKYFMQATASILTITCFCINMQKLMTYRHQ